nr:phosphatase PAP2 family protein [Lachnospiraceae bacterium]
KKPGIAVFAVAALIAFGRMYLFLHFPSDVLCGIILGIAIGVAADKICDLVAKKRNGQTEQE